MPIATPSNHPTGATRLHTLTTLCAAAAAALLTATPAAATPVMIRTYTTQYLDPADIPAPSPTPDADSLLNGFDIVITPIGGLIGNQPAIDAFNRAAATLEARIADPITVNINANLTNLGANNILGQAQNALVTTSYTTIRNLMAADSAAEPDDTIVASLPTSAQFTADLPDPVALPASAMEPANQATFVLDTDLAATTANIKALSNAQLFGVPDATITFNTNFDFDFDNSDGVTAGHTDFETVALHELIHALGFTSVVDILDRRINTLFQDPDEMPADDEIDYPNPFPVTARTLDLFRFNDAGANGGDDPDDASDFSTDKRWLRPGGSTITDEIITVAFGEAAMSTGNFNGNASQAGHWLDDNGNPLNNIGVMDPSLAQQTVIAPTEADFRALDLIGWDIQIIVPEPASAAMLVLGLGFAANRPRHKIS